MREDLVTVRQDLVQTRERITELSAKRRPILDAEVKQIAAGAERAKLERDLRPGDPVLHALAKHESRRLDDAILERDELEASLQRLRDHEKALVSKAAAIEAEMAQEVRQ